ncbi:hypothetical protein D3C71_1503790 [compost metagenome]
MARIRSMTNGVHCHTSARMTENIAHPGSVSSLDGLNGMCRNPKMVWSGVKSGSRNRRQATPTTTGTIIIGIIKATLNSVFPQTSPFNRSARIIPSTSSAATAPSVNSTLLHSEVKKFLSDSNLEKLSSPVNLMPRSGRCSG